jgi:uncharacterized membrane protein
MKAPAQRIAAMNERPLPFPFDREKALAEIVAQNQRVRRARTDYEACAEAARESKKSWEREATQLDALIFELEEQRQEAARLANDLRIAAEEVGS